MRWLSFGTRYVHEAVGGTETYVHRLARALQRRGVEVTAAFFSARPGRGEHDGVRYVALPDPAPAASRLEHWACAPRGLDGFQDLHDSVRPDVVHFHAALQVHAPEYFAAARRMGATTLWTYHAGGQTCLQTALLENGRTPCDGLVEAYRCTRCGLRWSGLPAPLASAFAAVDLHRVARAVPRRLGHPLERRHGVEGFRARLHEAFDLTDRMLTHAAWSRELLARNGFPAARTLELPLPPPDDADPPDGPSAWPGGDGRPRLLYAGRLLDIKGAHVAVEAVRGELRELPDVELLVLGAPGNARYERRLEAVAAGDRRIRLRSPVGSSALVAAMRAADAVVVPSLCLETGPYTVVEAAWMGTPVIGSRLGGIAERLAASEDGLTFVPGDARDLARCVLRLEAQRATPAARVARAREFRRRYAGAFDAALSDLLAVASR